MYDRNIFSEKNDGYKTLVEIALDLHWSWNHGSDFIWQYLDNERWEITQDPWSLLQTVSREKINNAFSDPEFCKQLSDLIALRQKSNKQTSWFENAYPQSPISCVTYFSMEFMLSESLPIYSGGLGNVAGDHMKGASDLGIPIIGIGLLYQQGYFRQLINVDGEQQVSLPFNDPWQLPITPVRNTEGDWLRVKIYLAEHVICLRIWKVKVGSRILYLLDSNDPINCPSYRGITNELYDGNSDTRLMQEIVLGIGGWRMLTKLGIKPNVCHLNEGHAAFATLERARALMEELDLSFNAALSITRLGNIFTSHTAVEVGFDRFSPQQISFFLGKYLHEELHISLDDFLALGRQNSKDNDEYFNTAFLAIRTSAFVNGVSRLHGEVSRKLFAPLFPRWPIDEIPIGYITNGVHMPSWDSAAADKLWTKNCQKARWMGSYDNLEKEIRKIPDDELWQLRNEASETFVTFLKKQLREQIVIDKMGRTVVDMKTHFFDPHVLTLGFARRFAVYKRPNLLLRNPDRLIRLLTNTTRPVRLVIAGKAHPKDIMGQAFIKQWHDFICSTGTGDHVIFLNDYNMRLAAQLIQGVDVWLNTPQRPWEACGTSGMKVLVNGGINLSVLDGWWAEAFSPVFGWALGDGLEHVNDLHWDDIEAEMLYELLEHEVIPEFYNRDAENIPTAWVRRMRESMAQLTPKFSTNRSLKEYIDNYYMPAAKKYLEYYANACAAGIDILKKQIQWQEKWLSIHFGKYRAHENNGVSYFEIEIYLNGLDVNNFEVQLYANGINGNCAEKHVMRHVNEQENAEGYYIFLICIPSTRAITDYTPRLIAAKDDTLNFVDGRYILWQK